MASDSMPVTLHGDGKGSYATQTHPRNLKPSAQNPPPGGSAWDHKQRGLKAPRRPKHQCRTKAAAEHSQDCCAQQKQRSSDMTNCINITNKFCMVPRAARSPRI